MLFAVCVVCCVGLVVFLRARVAHTLTHVGTVDDGRPQGVNLPPPPLFVFCLLPSLCVGWCLVVVVCVWVLCGGCCGVVGG